MDGSVWELEVGNWKLTRLRSIGYVDTHIDMAPPEPALSFTGLFILQALSQGHRFGFDIMEVTGLPSGTIYPALRRLEAFELVTSDWEKDLKARKEGRPRRRYYELTPAGKRQLKEAETRFHAVGRLFPKRSTS
jgi:PadR family transcriptional regulator, regulatory protein PadR